MIVILLDQITKPSCEIVKIKCVVYILYAYLQIDVDTERYKRDREITGWKYLPELLMGYR